MLSLKATSQLLEDKKTNHAQLNKGTYNFGDPWDFAAANTIKYPFFGARIIDGNSIENTINGANDVSAIEIFLCDLKFKDDSDMLQTYSDLKLMFLDVYAQLIWDLKNYFKANIPGSVTVNQIEPHFNNDECIGWSAVLLINQFFDKSTCSDISNGNAGKVIIYDSDGNVVAILNPNSIYILDPMFTETAETYTVTGTTQTILHTPNFIFGVFMNGQRLTLTTDYTVSGTTITFVQALANDTIVVVYNY